VITEKAKWKVFEKELNLSNTNKCLEALASKKLMEEFITENKMVPPSY
jgi:hypothetical protein